MIAGRGRRHPGVARLLALVVFASIGGPGRARAGPERVLGVTPVVAVLPFRDLSGGGGAVGEAIRETVTADLRELGGLRVVERGRLDRVLAELGLAAGRANLPSSDVVRVGKLLGASMLVAGAYQRVGKKVRLTARFVEVQTGEIVGATKVDGPAGSLLSLQDKVTAKLARSAGLGARKAAAVARRRRPRLKNLKSVELYGRAVVEPDGARKKALLEAAVAVEPAFTYAARDLDALEKRLAALTHRAGAAQSAAADALKRQALNATDPAARAQAEMQLFANLMTQRRWRRLLAESKRVLANPPPRTPGYPVDVAEMAQVNLVRAHEQLKDDDGLLREGERFLARFPASQQFSIVKMLMQNAIDRKREREEGVAKAAAELAALPPGERQDPCRRAGVFQSHAQTRDYRREITACIKRGGQPHAPGTAEFRLAFVCFELGDIACTRRTLKVLEKEFPVLYRDARHLEDALPVDD